MSLGIRRDHTAADDLSTPGPTGTIGRSVARVGIVRFTTASRLRRLSLAAVLLSVTGLVFAGVAAAAPVPTSKIDDVQKQLQKLQDDAEQATEAYNSTREQLKSINVMKSAADTRLKQQRKLVDQARKTLGRLAVQSYKAGDLQTLSLFLDDNPDSVLAAGGLLTTVTDRQAQAVAQLVAEQKKLAADQTDVSAQQSKLAAASAQLNTLKTQIEDNVSKTQALLSRLKGDEQAAINRLSGGSLDKDALAKLGVNVPANGMLTCPDVHIDYPNDRVMTVLKYACAQLGKKYVWGGDGPNVFDCSGLTMRAWEQVGVSLPHNAYMQAQEGTKVSKADLRPGDLIYFHSGLTHMGIYIGKGLMIHAPHTGDFVRIASARLDEIQTANRL